MSTIILDKKTNLYITNELNNIKEHQINWYLRLNENRKNIDFYDLIKYEKYHREIKKYTEEELDELLIQMGNLSKIKTYTQSQILFLGNRYCRDDELPIEMYALTALVIVSKEPKKTRINKLLEVFEAIYLGYISLATPILLNARFSLSEKTSISSCYISNVEDNLDSFADSINKTMKVLTYGGGMGLCVSEIRAKGSTLRGLKGKAKGVKKSFLTIISNVARSIDQGGLRPGNVTVAIGIDHMDCMDVINARREYGSDVSSIEDNISNLFPQIILNSLFMTRCKEKKEWYLFDPYECNNLGINLNRVYGDVYKAKYEYLENLAKEGKIRSIKYDNAMDLMKNIILSYIQTGFPYIYYKDNANKYNILNDNAINLCGNLCMESFTPIEELTHVCSLSSVNIYKANTEEKRVYYSKLTCRILNNLISIFNKNNPLFSVMIHNDKTKAIGIGIMGLADYYAERNILYSSSAAKEEASKIMEDIAYGAVLGSVELAKEYPTKVFQDFNKSSWNDGKMFSKDLEWFKNNSYNYERWEKIKNEISLYKIYNGYLLSIAPNTSTANVIGVSPSWFPRMNTTLQYKSTVGSVLIHPPIDEELWDNYEFDQDIDQNHKIDVALSLQKWTDQGVSFELVFSLRPGAYDKKLPSKLFEWFVNGWEKGLKTFYYGTSKVEIESKTCSLDNCESCSG